MLAAQPDLIPVEQISLELARDIAMKAVEASKAVEAVQERLGFAN